MTAFMRVSMMVRVTLMLSLYPIHGLLTSLIIWLAPAEFHTGEEIK